MTGRTQHSELGHFLRTRRERVAPESVGLPSGPRRRSRGLRREEVALLADVSPSWYTYLEQGRRVRPSAEVLDSLASALRLDQTERRYLHALGAGPAESVRQDPTPDIDTTALVVRLMQTSDVLPYPIYVMDGLGDLIAWNAQTTEWYCDFSAREGRGRNMVWWLFTAPEARERIASWRDDAREIVGRIRFLVGTSRAHPAVEESVRALYAASEDFARWWDEHDVVDQEARQRTFRHPRLGVRVLDLFVVRPAVNPAVSIVFHLPPDDDGDRPG